MLESLEGLIIGLASVNGLNTESMARGHGFRFMEIGRRLERALYTLNLLRTGCELPHETEKVVWEMVLAMTDSLMTYRRRYASATEAGPCWTCSCSTRATHVRLGTNSFKYGTKS